jgi:dethiobiotin synthetase
MIQDMIRGLFITGTDTSVGKTVVSAAVIQRYRSEASLHYWKPVQTGDEDDTETVRFLGDCSSVEILNTNISLKAPVSPHLAARLAGRTLRFDEVIQPVRDHPESLRWIVEGAGGVLVPMNDTQMMIDLIAELDLPVALVTRSSLGTINHTLLTLEALRRRSLRVAGVVMVGPPEPENRLSIERYGGVTVLGEMPRFGTLTAAAVKDWAIRKLDPGNLLMEFLR